MSQTTPPRPASQFVDVNGLRVHYVRAGQGEPVLLLLHGSFLSLHSWQPVLPALAAHGTVLALDRPAFGRTARPQPATGQPNPYSPEGQADLLPALLDALGLRQAVLVGNSAGGTVALLAALRHPERVAALVLSSAMVYSGYAVVEFPPWLRAGLTRLGGVGALPLRLLLPLVYRRMVRSFWHDPARMDAAILAAHRETLHQPGWDRALWQLILASHALHLARHLPQIAQPTLVLSGAHDRTVPTAESERLAHELPNAHLTLLPACAHLPHEEQPELFAAAVAAFVHRLPTG